MQHLHPNMGLFFLLVSTPKIKSLSSNDLIESCLWSSDHTESENVLFIKCANNNTQCQAFLEFDEQQAISSTQNARIL